MRLPRRQFLRLAAGAAALPAVSRSFERRLIRRDRYTSSSVGRPAAGLMLSRA
jgi:hypothetical protein